MQTGIRVLVIEPDLELQRHLLSTLEHTQANTDDIYLLGAAADAKSAAILCATETPDVILMDISAVSSEGVANANHYFPYAQIILLANDSSEMSSAEVFLSEAVGYVFKGVGGEELHQAIRTAHAGKNVMPKLPC